MPRWGRLAWPAGEIAISIWLLLLDFLHKMVQRSLGLGRTGTFSTRCFLAYHASILFWALHPLGSTRAVVGLAEPEMSSMRTLGESISPKFSPFFLKGWNVMVAASYLAGSVQLFWPQFPEQQQQLPGEERFRVCLLFTKSLLDPIRSQTCCIWQGCLLSNHLESLGDAAFQCGVFHPRKYKLTTGTSDTADGWALACPLRSLYPVASSSGAEGQFSLGL